MNNMNPVAYGLVSAVIGIAVVFAMLTILIAFVWFMGKLISGMVNSREAKAAGKAAAAAPAPPLLRHRWWKLRLWKRALWMTLS